MLRSLLFAPANVPRRVEKALILESDAVILDLEDAVPISEKTRARSLAAAALKNPRKSVGYVRVNALSTGMTIDDLMSVISPHLDGIMLAKVEEAADLHKVDWLMHYLEEKASMPRGALDLIPLVENARGVHNAHEIAKAVPRVKRLCFGAVDYTADLGIKLTDGGSELFYARSCLVNASRAAGLEPPIDTVYTDIKNAEGLEKDTGRAVTLGFQGKLVIHPDQIAIVNTMFSPSAADIAYAQKIVTAFERAESLGHAAITLEDGKFIDYPVVHSARRILKLAEKISPGICGHK